LDIGLRHNAAHRHRYIHTNKPLFITIRYETVRTARPGPFAEPAFADKQVDAFLRRNVVFRKVLHNRDTALYAGYGERRHVEVRKVRRIDEDVVRDRAIVVLCRFPGVQNRVVNILQNFFRRLTLPRRLLRCALCHGNGGNIGVVDNPCRTVLRLSEIGIDVHILIKIQTDTVVIDLLDTAACDSAAKLILNLNRHGDFIGHYLVQIFAEISLDTADIILHAADAVRLSARYAVLDVKG